MSLQSMIDGLPQRRHLNDFHIRKYSESIIAMGLDPDFHIRRAAGVGGSESAAILAHYHSNYTSEKINDSFKTAEEISLEKLFMVLPQKDTIYTRRGKGIEGFTADCFELRHKCADKIDGQLAEACRQHKTNPFMLGNTDRTYNLKSRRVIIDFKSSSSPFERIPFTYIVQLNHYAANANSNGEPADELGIVNISAPEELFPDIIKAYEEREQNPGPYHFWLDQVANDRSSCVKLHYYQVDNSLALQSTIDTTIRRFFNEYPLQGKAITHGEVKKVLNDAELAEAASLEYQLFNLISMQKAVAAKIQAVEVEANQFAKSVNGGFEWPEASPVKVSTTKSLNIDLAVKVLQAQGADISKMYAPSNKLDTVQVLELLSNLGADASRHLYKSELDVRRVEAELQRLGIDRNLVMSADYRVSAAVSRKNIFKDQVAANQFDIEEMIESSLAKKAGIDRANMEHKNESTFNILRQEQ